MAALAAVAVAVALVAGGLVALRWWVSWLQWQVERSMLADGDRARLAVLEQAKLDPKAITELRQRVTQLEMKAQR